MGRVIELAPTLWGRPSIDSMERRRLWLLRQEVEEASLPFVMESFVFTMHS